MKKEIKDRAKRIFENSDTDLLYVNKKGSFFTSKNLALNSVDKVEDIEEIKRESVLKTNPKGSNGSNDGKDGLTPMQKAKSRAEAIAKMDTIEAIEKALEGETANSVKKAGAERIKALKELASKGGAGNNGDGTDGAGDNNGNKA
ncbi:hypothetical protein [Flagellimonas onchidii]|uniref:hypothetical protein n=1 Tax=Flagellimonas onchidii TaxID=2562684 RepID=UPI0010A5D69A|nr:hypothetical protein [Allomuricauda onchidii]